jgi:hypothetical protein
MNAVADCYSEWATSPAPEALIQGRHRRWRLSFNLLTEQFRPRDRTFTGLA